MPVNPSSAAVGWPHRREDWEFALALGQGFTLSADDEVVGVGLWWGFGPGHATLGTIIVAPDRQGQGIGKLLTERLIAATDGRTLGLVATPQGEPLYARYGFTRFEGHPRKLFLPTKHLLTTLEAQRT